MFQALSGLFNTWSKLCMGFLTKSPFNLRSIQRMFFFCQCFVLLPCTSKVQLWSTGQWRFFFCCFFVFLFLNNFRDIKWRSKTFFDKWFNFLLWCFPLWKSLSANLIYWMPLNRHMANTIAKSCWENKHKHLMWIHMKVNAYESFKQFCLF